MGKDWDNAVPGSDYWKSCLRIIKPGGFLLAMGGSRTFHRLALSIEEAGFEIRDTIMWIYGSGFPKSHNDFGIDGYGTALKPAYEPIIMAMKPLDGTFKQNAEKWGQAGINIEGCRIGTDDTRVPASKNVLGIMNDDGWKCKPMIVGSAKGRWPANVIFDEEAGQLLDEQSGQSKSPAFVTQGQSSNQGIIYGADQRNLRKVSCQNDSGGASRFFYCAKASSRERNEGLEGLPFQKAGIKNDSGRGLSESDPMKEIQYKNNHPTVKPIKLMEYLIRLVMPPKDGILLDPFAGSGTTILAAKRLGFNAIGIEKQAEYVDIARARIAQEDLFAC
jgi:site-specific DNA-methyltransferase (adenine-specific)